MDGVDSIHSAKQKEVILTKIDDDTGIFDHVDDFVKA
jgi:hypothetical protein